jgi:hypothetical protein
MTMGTDTSPAAAESAIAGSPCATARSTPARSGCEQILTAEPGRHQGRPA